MATLQASESKKVKVEVVAEQLMYTFPNGDGTYTTQKYLRGAVLEMDEEHAKSAAAGEVQGLPYVGKNAAGTEVWIYPPKTPGAARASVKILKGSDAKTTAPEQESVFVPAPQPKPASSER